MSRYGREQPPLFWSQDGFAVKQAQINSAIAAVGDLQEERILNSDLDALTKYFVDKFAVDVPVLDISNVSATENEQQIEAWDHFSERAINIPGVAFNFEIPFSGDPGIFSVRPSSFDSAPPHAEIRGNTIYFSVAGQELTAEQVQNALHQTTAAIEKYLGWHREFWGDLGANIAREVRTQLDARRARILKQKGIAAGLASIGVKLKEKPGDARTYVPPAIKQKLIPQLPPMKPAQKPEPTLDHGQYETILSLVHGAGRSIEQSSSRTRALDEVTLRDMLLVPLNAHFGSATGEAFNFTGKTDILIRHQGGNLFVAECKIWHGEKNFLAAIDQLLGYLSWRDTKAVLVIFNRNTEFSGVIQKIAELPKTHARYISGSKNLGESSFQFIFGLPQDISRQVTLTVMGFDLGVTATPRIRPTS
jgi:hypothetical protein